MSTLRPFQWTYPDNDGSGFTIIPPAVNRDLQQYFLKLANDLKTFDVTINHDVSNKLGGYLKERLQRVQKQQLRLIHRYMNEIESLHRILKDVRKNSMNQTVRDRVQLALNEIMNELTKNLDDLEAKAQLINNLNKRNIQYYNVADFVLGKTDNEQALKRRLIKTNLHSRILCSDDILNNNNPSELDKLLRQLTEERKTIKDLRLIYADFSFCPFKLPDIMILPSDKKINEQRQISLLPSLINNDVINILLLGETGVGKSTFINAFVNYLTFKTLKQAESNKPVAFIPVSFLLTTGHQFNEHMVTFGDFDSSNNEDFDHPGQSVTQHCRSYLLTLKHMGGIKLRIIDTPGFGDTRGLDQDDKNMQHILKYINNLSHLNAICFLLKPNVSQLNIFFRACLTQLLDLLGPNARQNIIFCFTNARSTFYTPGNTAPLLRAMLDSLSINDIPFKKENTFCFDNESFRYLVALQNGIRFDEEEKHEYETSWRISVSESNRLLNYVHKQLHLYFLHNGWQSDKHAQIEIIQMIRPILETMRNILRNMILKKVASSDKCIELCPKAFNRPVWFCTLCHRDPFLLCNFWILPDHPHELGSKCRNCMCQPNQHIPIDYILSYDISNDLSNHQSNEMNDMLDQLCFASAEFAYFLINVVHSTKEDVFLVGLMRIIEEEKQICAEVQEKNHLNFQLVKELEKLKQQYEAQIKSNQKHLDLQAIYKWIQTVHECPMVRKQMVAIKGKQEIRMQHHQSEIS
jgi:GTP-binding protein EngB required for normal cell division